MNFKFSNLVDNIVEVHKRAGKADSFPLDWFDKYPAKEGGVSTLQTSDGDLVMETREFEEVIIWLNQDPDRPPEITKRMVQQFMDKLLAIKVRKQQAKQGAAEMLDKLGATVLPKTGNRKDIGYVINTLCMILDTLNEKDAKLISQVDLQETKKFAQQVIQKVEELWNAGE